MKSAFAIAALLGVSVSAANNVAIEGPTLSVKGVPFAKMTMTTGWTKDRENTIDGDEVLSLMITSKIELLDGGLYLGDEIQFWHCGPYMHGNDNQYCTAYHHHLAKSVDWDT